MSGSKQTTWIGRAIGYALLVLVCCWAPGTVRGEVILGFQDWDSSPAAGIGAWANDTDELVLAVTTGPENTTDWMGITYASGDALNQVVKMPAADLFVGQWDPSMWIEFDFWTDTGDTATALEVRWEGTNTSKTLSYSLAPSAAGWSSFNAPLADWNQWNSVGTGATVDDFLADLGSIDWVGVYISRGVEEEAMYGLDDFGLMVPEPEEYALLAMALLALLAVKRRLGTPRSVA